jgi:hypothetical protein
MKLEPSLETLQARIELRVLFGPQAGSRLQVAPGNYDLGEGDECEVILSGPKMLGRHAQLSFDGEQLTISPLDGKVCDAQGNEITESFPLGLGMPVEMGGIWISVDDVDASGQTQPTLCLLCLQRRRHLQHPPALKIVVQKKMIPLMKSRAVELKPR